MTPKTLQCINQEQQDNFSCKHENTRTLKSMEFYKRDKYFKICPHSVFPHATNFTRIDRKMQGHGHSSVKKNLENGKIAF